LRLLGLLLWGALCRGRWLPMRRPGLSWLVVMLVLGVMLWTASSLALRFGKSPRNIKAIRKLLRIFPRRLGMVGPGFGVLFLCLPIPG